MLRCSAQVLRCQGCSQCGVFPIRISIHTIYLLTHPLSPSSFSITLCSQYLISLSIHDHHKDAPTEVPLPMFSACDLQHQLLCSFAGLVKVIYDHHSPRSFNNLNDSINIDSSFLYILLFSFLCIIPSCYYLFTFVNVSLSFRMYKSETKSLRSIR